ncbi:HAT repeat-containing protein [Cavenderia fasciculata]|uniref:HAT repeat-containing protein n=1 Tax=Cavenderia fasciculata TaxID=261658 RepID=F4QD42_CACFS|nr:HAT repeat-containing protein [Cavenderia fasciculata]EGG14513.1 HAT repeat-containing protein [Cavenderia fasciculata]|eukprot:XP_004353929.1 HAT repeat-containing protein [Cavenderia fasciculata]
MSNLNNGAQNAMPSKVTKVKNKSAAPIQITSEHILRVALDGAATETPKAPKQHITDQDELEAYRTRKRKGYEETLIRTTSMVVFQKYASWEESQKEFDRARSIYERCLERHHRNVQVWLRYADMEMRNKFINHARNVWDRAVALLPRVPQLWYKYSFFEDMMGNSPGARAVFDRWMQWKPEPQAWNSYIKFEIRLNLLENARNIFEKYILVHPFTKTWIKYAKFEEKHGDVTKSRSIFSRAIDFLGDEGCDESIFISFAKFEERYKEVERARLIYKYALDHIPKSKAQLLFETFTNFEKQHGDRIGIEDILLSKKRFQYEEDIKLNSKNYDVWFDYTRLEENNGDVERTREIYERAISNIPPMYEKKYWRRYIYLWINYALFEELGAKDIDKTREVYQAVTKLIPHKQFSFSKIWIMYANFEIRQLQLQSARQILGQALGLAPKQKVLDTYIQLEIKLGSFDRVRKLYEKYIHLYPDSCDSWSKFAQFEAELGETKRVRGIYEIAVQQESLETPEIVWKNYIDFEIERKDFGAVRALYRRLLERTNHIKVWISFAQMECTAAQEPNNARDIFAEANKALKGAAAEKEERYILLENWKHFENKFGNTEQIEAINKQMPKKVIKRRIVKNDFDEETVEEYYDYVFPEEQSAQPNLKFLEMAQKWKKQKMDN